MKYVMSVETMMYLAGSFGGFEGDVAVVCVAVAVRIEVTANMVRGKGERAFLLAAYGKNAYQILIKRFKFTDLPSNLTLSLLK